MPLRYYPKTMPLNDFGKNNLLAEECSILSIKPLIQAVNEKLKDSLLTCEIQCKGLDIRLTESTTGNGGKRYWFLCPLCDGRCGVLFQNPMNQAIGCRKCLGIKYLKSVKKGMAEDIENSFISRKNIPNLEKMEKKL